MDWLSQLTPIEHVFFWMAVIASVALVVQIILLIVSFGGGADSDFTDFDGDMDTDGGLSFFTVKGITAFFALGGWCGFAAASYLPDNIWAPILIAVATGAAALGVAKLQCSGNVVKEKLEGLTATVYVSVPPARSGRGKVTLTAQGRYMEIDAVTDEEERIPVDVEVEIVSYKEDFAVVKRK